MVQIQAVPIWNNGQIKIANYLNAFCINDNLIDAAVFKYELYETLNQNNTNCLANGNLTMSGQDYLDWNNNEYAYSWIADQLSLTIIQ